MLPFDKLRAMSEAEWRPMAPADWAARNNARFDDGKFWATPVSPPWN